MRANATVVGFDQTPYLNTRDSLITNDLDLIDLTVKHDDGRVFAVIGVPFDSLPRPVNMEQRVFIDFSLEVDEE